MIRAARETIVNEGVHCNNLEVEGWLQAQRLQAQNVATNCLVSDHAPNFTHLLSNPRLIEWASRPHAAMSHHVDVQAMEDASTLLNPTIQARVDA